MMPGSSFLLECVAEGGDGSVCSNSCLVPDQGVSRSTARCSYEHGEMFICLQCVGRGRWKLTLGYAGRGILQSAPHTPFSTAGRRQT